MQPGDEVILPYEEYSQLRQAYKDNPSLVKENKDLKKINQELSHKLSVTQQKLVLKNALFCKEQFKAEYLMSLFDDINTAFGIKAEDIGKGMKFLRNMEDSYFSIIKLPGEVDQYERLPDNFSKSNTYIEIDTELHAYKNLAEVCTKEWNEKLKLVEYLESSLKTAQNKDINKIQQQAQKMQKQLKGQVERLNQIVKDLKIEVEEHLNQKIKVQSDNQKLVQQQNSTKSVNDQLKELTNQLKSQNIKLKQNLHDKCQELKKLQAKIQNMMENMTSNNLQVENHLKKQIQLLQEDKNLLKQKLVELKQHEENANKKIHEMKENELKLNDKVNKLTVNENSLKNEIMSLHIDNDQLRRFAQISTQKVEALKNEVQKLQKQVLQLRSSTSKPSSSTSDHVTDIKSKLFSLIGEYIIYLNKSMQEINLTIAEKKTIIRSEVLEVEEQFGRELKKLKL